MSGTTCENCRQEPDRRADFQQLLDRLLTEESFAHVRSHGNADWTPHTLASVAMLWAWQSLGGLVVRFESSCRVLSQLIPGAVLPGTYQAFVKALAPHSEDLIQVVLASLPQRMQQGAVSSGLWAAGVCSRSTAHVCEHPARRRIRTGSINQCGCPVVISERPARRSAVVRRRD